MELLISAILDAVFASLAESIGVSDWVRNRLGRDPEKLAFRTALTKALADSGEHFQGRDLCYFAEMLRDFGGPLLARTLQPAATLPTAVELTTAWLTHLNLDSVVYYRADFEHFATIFLTSLQHNLENQQPLRWIVQLRTQKLTADAAHRSADAAEESAELLAALQAQLQQLNERLAYQSQTNTAGGAVVAGNVQTDCAFVGRDQITMRNYFMGGLERLHIDYSARIEEFLLEYLGSRRKRVPFGGRTAQLAKLDAWLTDHTAPPYYLMTAEAGRGKSALVCRWQTQVLTFSDVDVIFLPISIRFETATQEVVFAALAARLAVIYGEEIQAAVLSADQWSATCQSYLRREPPDGKQLLVILDGLDEAIGWKPGRGLFPGDPPDRLRVLVTARQRAGETGPEGWAATLGWDDVWLARKEALKGLDRTGVQEALVSMSNPLDKLATQVDVIGELFRLTEGDPLLVRLYVDALVGKGADAAYLRAEDLATIQPGLKGYFDRWWDDQYQQWSNEGHDPIVEQGNLLTLLNAVAAALGPLTYSDLAAISDLTNGLLVRRLAQTVSRWLIGDGSHYGYRFSHPRLGYYFREQLGETEKAAWDAQFTAWGAATLDALNSSKLNPKAVPQYLIHYYAAHLQRSNALVATYYGLMSDGWRKAWEEVDVSYSGFLNDIDCAKQKAQQTYIPNDPGSADALAQQVKALLCRASISALSGNLTPEILALMVIHGLRTPTQAVSIAMLMPYAHQRVDSLKALLPHLPKKVLTEALAAATGREDEYNYAEVLCSACLYLPQWQLEEAVADARNFNSIYSRVETLGWLAARLPQPHQAEVLVEALATAKAIDDEYICANALSHLVYCLAELRQDQLLTEALAAIVSLKEAYFRATALTTTLSYVPTTQQATVLEAALAAVQQLEPKSPRVSSLMRWLAPHLPKSQRDMILIDELQAARALEDKSVRINILLELAPHISEPLIEEILATVAMKENEGFRAEAWKNLAAHLPDTMLVEALNIAKALKDEYSRFQALGALAYRLSKEQQIAILDEAGAAAQIGDDTDAMFVLVELAPQLSKPLLIEMLNAIKEIKNSHSRAELLIKLAPHLSEPLLVNAIVETNFFPNERVRAKTLVELAIYLPKQLRTEALTVVRAALKESELAYALIELAPYFHGTTQSEVLMEALATARSIEVRSRVYILRSLSYRLPEGQKVEILKEALSATKTIDGEIFRSSALAVLAADLSQPLLTEALVVARALRDKSHRMDTLTKLLPYLSGTEQSVVVREVLATVGSYKYEFERVNALGRLAPYLHEPLFTVALAVVKRLKEAESRADALGALAPYLPQPLLMTAFTIARAIKVESYRANALTALVPHLPKDQQTEIVTEALTTARAIEGATDKANALAALVPHFSKNKQTEIIAEALSVARGIELYEDQIYTLSELSLLLPEKQQAQTLAEALALVNAIIKESDRADALRALVPPLVQLGKSAPESAYIAFIAVTDLLGYRWRPQFFNDLKILLPFILSMAGNDTPATAAGIFCAIRDVCKW